MENNSIDSETWVKPDSFSSIKVFLKMIILFLLTFSLNQEVYNKREGSLTWGTCCWLKDSGLRVLRVSCLWLVLWITDKSEVSSCFLPNSHGCWIIGLWLLMLLDKYMHQKSFPWKWRSVVESPKEAWCQSIGPGRFLLTKRRNVAFDFMPFCYWTPSNAFFLL